MSTTIEQRNMALTKRWERNWNEDVERMVDESYAPDCVVINMFTGLELKSREALRKVEHAILDFDGERRMAITNMVASGNVVAVQADSIFGTYRGKAVVFLTFNNDGQIVSDNTYADDPSGVTITSDAVKATGGAPTIEAKSATEKANIERVKFWQHTWNDAVDRMVDECYAPDCTVVNMMTGHTLRGREELRQIEHAMAAFDGTRRMAITRMVASGDQVAIQMDAFWNETPSKATVFLTFGPDGLIVTDNSYGQDPSGASTPSSGNFIGRAAS